MEVAGRAVLVGPLAGSPLVAAGHPVAGLAKIIENMEVGHNIIHGQFDWTGDPARGKTYEWDIVGTADNWPRPQLPSPHHPPTFMVWTTTRAAGVLRLFPNKIQPTCSSPFMRVIFALLFQWGVAIQDLRVGRYFIGKMSGKALFRQAGPREQGRPPAGQGLCHLPLLVGPCFHAASVLGGLAANGISGNDPCATISDGALPPYTVETFPAASAGREWKPARIESILRPGSRLIQPAWRARP